MSLSIGIVGLPNVGKSTLFNILTKKKVEASNYPFCTIDPNVGVVKVPDNRLEKIAEISKPAKIIPTFIEFTDIAGLVKGAHDGEGLGNQFLSHIRECDAICEVVRDFKDINVIHVNGEINPENDQETITMELIFADIKTIEKRLAKTIKEAHGNDKKAIKEKEILEKIKDFLDKGQAIRNLEVKEEEKEFIKSLNLLTSKPIIYALNSDDLNKEINFPWDGEIIRLNVKLEEEISNLPEEEQIEYMKELGINRSGLDKLISASYKLLGLETFFTTGKDETRAWTIKTGTKAPQAAGEIHTDFIKGFVRAEIINWEKFVETGGDLKAKELGLIRTEGKDYVVRDGDICNFLINK
ncbi:MAG TPA: redox-regulated ATPase YchF [bacterium]|nr:redox-regulated ATPase YchF [bacterium]